MKADIWEYNNGRIILYSEDPAVWEKMKKIIQDYSDDSGCCDIREMTRYYKKGSNKQYARQYIAPSSQRQTFEKIFGISDS